MQTDGRQAGCPNGWLVSSFNFIGYAIVKDKIPEYVSNILKSQKTSLKDEQSRQWRLNFICTVSFIRFMRWTRSHRLQKRPIRQQWLADKGQTNSLIAATTIEDVTRVKRERLCEDRLVPWQWQKSRWPRHYAPEEATKVIWPQKKGVLWCSILASCSSTKRQVSWRFHCEFSHPKTWDGSWMKWRLPVSGWSGLFQSKGRCFRLDKLIALGASTSVVMRIFKLST